jgi:hypothetical protein
MSNHPPTSQNIPKMYFDLLAVDIHENCSDLNRKVPPINSEVPGTLEKH